MARRRRQPGKGADAAVAACVQLPLFGGTPAPAIVAPTAEPDGRTYDRRHDRGRLARQYAVVWAVAADGRWRTPAEWEAATGYGWASVGARLRDFRKQQNGGHAVERRRRGDPRDGLHEYRLVPAGE